MELVHLADAPGYRPDSIVAEPFLDGDRSNVRLIRLAPGQALPPHTHGECDLMLYAVEGEGTIDPDPGTAGKSSDILQHLFTTVAEARSFNSSDLQ